MAKSQSASDQKNGNSKLFFLSLTALGVVFGDIGTSPLYAIRECFHGEYGISPSPANIFGVLSLIFWSLILIVTLKYLLLILQADYKGEGGVLALSAKIRNKKYLFLFGLFGAALLYGDSMITPAISVLGALEGLSVVEPHFEGYIIPLATLILFLLFFFQNHGTAKVGRVFGPVMLVWFTVLALLGLKGIIEHPRILSAVSPLWGAQFLITNKGHGFLVLGAVFLVVTGCEALYADLGHFGKKPIRYCWYLLVLPALLLNYFGQGGLLLDNPSLVHNPFYTLAPKFLLIPLLILATAATIIASQAVISGAYSLTLQAIQMGYCPRFVIQHTSADEKGQIYIPEINWSLMLATISLVYIFRTSSHLAAAYGVSVTTTMVITTIIFFEVVRTKFKWPLWACILFLIGFLIIDLAFFSANIVKIAHGAWFPLVIGLFTFVLFKTWRDGRDLLAKRFQEKSMRYDLFFKDIQENPPQRIPGKAVFMTGNLDIIPPALLQNLAHNKILHETVIFMTIITHNDPRVPGEDKVEVKDLGNGFFRVTAHFGFFEEPNMPYIFALVREKGLDLKLLETSFFLGRENLLATKRPGMAIWRERLFAFMSKNARSATAFYRIPPEIVVELGAQIEL